MKTYFTFLAFFLVYQITAQSNEPIQADRPDQTETPAIVPKGMFQVETGFTYQKEDAQNSAFSLPSTRPRFWYSPSDIITTLRNRDAAGWQRHGYTVDYFE